MKSKKSILIVGYYLPPLMGSHGQKIINYLKYLDSCGWNIEVLTVNPNENFPLYDKKSCKEIPENVLIHRVEPGPIREKYYSSKKIIGGEKLNENSFQYKISNLMKCGFKTLLIETNLEHLTSWVIFAIIKGIKLVKVKKYDIILSSGCSEPHIVGYFLKRFSNDSKYIINYGDPWVFDPTYSKTHTKLKFILDHAFEKKLLKIADVACFNTIETKELYLDKYPILKTKKTEVINTGSNYLKVKINPISSSEKFRFLYAGSIYPHRSISEFILAIIENNSELAKNNIEILFIGNIDKKIFNIDSISNNNILKFQDFVPYNQLVNYIAGANALISFGNTGGVQLPGKLMDYLSSGKPILWIKNGEYEPALNYLNNKQRAFVVFNDRNQIYQGIIDIFNKYSDEPTDNMFFEKSEDPSIYSWENNLAILNEICTSLLIDNSRK